MKEEEELTKSIKALVELTFIPLKAMVDAFAEALDSLEKSLPRKTRDLAISLVDAEINALKALNAIIEKQISLLESYKEKMIKKEKKERIRVE